VACLYQPHSVRGPARLGDGQVRGTTEWGKVVISGARIPRFWSKVNVSGSKSRRLPGSCWLWKGSKRDGYGLFQADHGQTNAHRVAWAFMNGPIPKGMLVLHKCDRPACCNPDHLFLGTIQDNMRDRNRKSRHAYGERHSRAILTDRLVREIRKKYSRKLRRGEARILAAKYGISIPALSHVRRRLSWRHVK
jgi:HNH endonuclease